jgi:hypothetical protein
MTTRQVTRADASELTEFPLKVLEERINEKRKQIERNGYSKSIPLARFYDQEKVAFLEPIFTMLKNIQERVKVLERGNPADINCSTVQQLDAANHLLPPCTMTTRQVTRDELRGLYAKTQAGRRLKHVARIVTQIYGYVMSQAEKNPATTFIYIIPEDHPFYMANMSDIVAGLQERFPDSAITQRSILRTPDGKDHVISHLIPSINRLGQLLDAIVIDWS